MTSKRAGSPGGKVQVFEIEVGDQTLVVTSVPAPRRVRSVEGLTPAERAVAQLAMTGVSNAAIARKRRCSPRTIANQLASAYRKLGVQSRAELAARLAGHGTK